MMPFVFRPHPGNSLEEDSNDIPTSTLAFLELCGQICPVYLPGVRAGDLSFPPPLPPPTEESG